MSMQYMLEVEIYNIWVIDFMGPSPQSLGNTYVLLVVDYG